MDWLQDVLAVVRIDQVALAGIVTLGIIGLFRGWLFPKSTVDDLRGERDSWKAAYVDSERAGRIKDSQISELLELSRTATRALQSIPGGDHVAQATQPSRPAGAG